MEDSTNKLVLPKKHLSWSSINCWMTNPERFRREYFENSEKLDTKYLRFGKGIAELIEKGLHKELLPDLPVYSNPEYKLQCDVMGVPVLGFIDSYEPAENVFLEYKTGKNPWTQAKVQKHDQLTLYATMLKVLTGKMPAYCDLVWIETKEGSIEVEDFWRTNEKQINLTGKMVVFRREFDEREIDRMEFIVQKAAEEISDAYQKFIEEI